MTPDIEPADLALLVILGSADQCPVSIDELPAIARQVAPKDWQPTNDVIIASVERALERRLVTRGGGACGSAILLETTPLGRLWIIEALRKPIPNATGGFVRACISAKAAFLHHLPHPERSSHAQELVRLYREAIAFLRHDLQLSQSRDGPVMDHLHSELVLLESERSWLESLTHWRIWQQAAE